MKIRNTLDLIGTDRDVEFNAGRSIRILLEKDKMGFSLHKTLIRPGTYHWHYKHHLEACYCISGEGEVKDLETGEVHPVKPDVTYILDNYDNHTFTAFTDVVLISVFNPPVLGQEIHREDGSYECLTINI